MRELLLFSVYGLLAAASLWSMLNAVGRNREAEDVSAREGTLTAFGAGWALRFGLLVLGLAGCAHALGLGSDPLAFVGRLL